MDSQPVTDFRSPRMALPEWVNLVAGYLIMVALSFGVSVAMAANSGITIVNETVSYATLHFEADSGFLVWPDNCARVRWRVEHIKQIYVNDEGVGGTGEETLCLDHGPNFRIIFQDDTEQIFTIPLTVVNRAYILSSLIVPAIVLFLLSATQRKSWALVAIVAAGFGLAYLLCFIVPFYFSPDGRMHYPEFLPGFPRPGYDLRWYRKFSLEFFGVIPDADTPNNYPPLQTLFLAPLALLPVPVGLVVLTLLTLACYCIYAGYFPIVFSPTKQLTPLLTLIFVTGALSYGLQYEFQQGQYNVIAMTLCLAAAYLYHYHSRWKLVAYAMFTIAVQIKLFPLIFLILFVKDWRKWKENIIRFGALIAVNFACLFALGPAEFSRFFNALRIMSKISELYSVVYNTSISSFTERRLFYGINPPGGGTTVAAVLLGITVVCGALSWWAAHRQNSGHPSRYLLLVCTIIAIVLPALSSDYKLPLLAPVVAMSLDTTQHALVPHRSGWLWQRIALFVLVFAYATTLFSYATKYGMLTMNLPALMVMLVAATILSFLTPPSAKPDPAPATATL